MPSHNQGYEISINGVSSTTIPEFICEKVTRQMIGERRHTIEAVPGLEGGWLFPEAPGMREIVLTCHVLADTFPADRRAAVRAVANWVDNLGYAELEIADDPGVFNQAILSEPPNVDEWREKGTFDLVFLALPYTFSTTVQNHEEVSVTASKTFNVTVNGDVATRPVVQIVATGTSSKATLTIATRVLEHTASLATTVIRTINCLARVVETTANNDPNVDGSFDPNDLSMAGVVGTFPILQPGVNSVTLLVTGSTGWTADFYWRDKFR